MDLIEQNLDRSWSAHDDLLRARGSPVPPTEVQREAWAYSIESLRRIVRVNPSFPAMGDVYYFLGELSLRTGDTRGAHDYLFDGMFKYGSRHRNRGLVAYADLRVLWGVSSTAPTNLEMALKALENAAGFDQRHPGFVQYRIAWCHWKLGKTGDAARVLRETAEAAAAAELDVEPGAAELRQAALDLLVVVHAHADRPRDAMASLGSAAPHDTTALFEALAKAYEEKAAFTDANTVYRTLIRGVGARSQEAEVYRARIKANEALGKSGKSGRNSK